MKKIISVLVAISLMFTLASCGNKKVQDTVTTTNNITTPNGENSNPPVEDNRANISTILNSEPDVDCFSFSEGFAYVSINNKTTYIIDTNGYVCAEVPFGSTYGEVVCYGDKYPFYDGVSIIWSNINYVETTVSVDTSGNIINTWEDCIVLAINEKNLLCVVEYEETVDGRIERIGTQNYKGEWVTGPFEWPYATSPEWGSYKGHNIVEIRGGTWYFDMTSGQIYSKWREIPIKSDNLYFNTITPVSYMERKKEGYWNGESLAIDLKDKGVVTACDFVDGVGVYSTFNGSNTCYLWAIDNTGKKLFEPIKISKAQSKSITTYSEGYLPIWIYNEDTYAIDRIDYIDKSGVVAFSIPGVSSTTGLPNLSVHNGIVTNGYHYYNTKGEMLF